MPFAKKFQATVGFPFPGDTFEGFLVEMIDVRDEAGGPGSLHRYTVEMIVSGLGGQQGVRRALRPFVEMEPLTFSGYGNSYSCWLGRPEIESLGNKRYHVTILAGSARIDLEGALERFIEHLREKGALSEQTLDTEGVAEQLVQSYLDAYRTEVRLHVGRYRSKLKRIAARQEERD